jgi:hypothetical protein
MRAANTVIIREKHPIPTIEERISDLNGGIVFSTLDLMSAYHQLELDPKSRYMTTLSTHMGLFRYKILLFGVNATSEVIQSTIAEILSDLKGCLNISDDIIVHGKTMAEHDTNLKAVLKRLQDYNVRLNLEKCKFAQPHVTFNGHVFGKDGLAADPKKIDALVKATPPSNASEVKSFLGMAQYVARFVPNYATITTSLRELTRQDTPWIWEKRHQEAFQDLQKALAHVMEYFDARKLSEIIVDASPTGLGGIFTQNNKVISYSRSLRWRCRITLFAN